MFSSTVGRGRFFVYSAVLVVVEIVLVAVCIAATMGFHGLAESKPGASREGLALAVFVVTAALWAVRSKLAWSRGRDAAISKWIVVSYILLSACFVILQALTLLVYKFDGDSGNAGLNVLGLVLMGMWGHLLIAAPKHRDFDPDSFLEAEGYGAAPGRRSLALQAEAAPRPARAAAPRTAPSAVRPLQRSAGFGRRGAA